MTIKEVFSKPTVKQVIFQIKFPNLFSLENKIGDLQLKIMQEFPRSSIALRRQVLFADLGPEVKPEEIQKTLSDGLAIKIWRFESDKKFQLNITTGSLDISSEYHKTYNLKNGNKFKDIIRFVLDNFFKTISIPIINRIGLRYIDECPIPAKNNEKFREYYNSVFPLDRFDLTNAKEMVFKTVVKRNKHSIQYIEALIKIEDEYKLILDFDGFAENIKSKDCLQVTDNLHTLISEEYEKTIKEPVKKYMRQKEEG